MGLVLQNRKLMRRIEALTQSVYAAERPPTLIEGQAFPHLTLRDAAGAPVELARPPEHTATLLLVSSATCDLCESVRPVWKQVAETASGSHLRVLELVLGAEPEALVDRVAPYGLVSAGDDAWSLVGRIPGVPAAILIEDTGLVLRAFYGEEHDGLQQAVKGYLFPE